MIFKKTLRKYVIENNRSSFEIYAKAVGFNPNHVGLLYLTLQLEKDQFESNSINKKRSYSEMYDSDIDQENKKKNTIKITKQNKTNSIQNNNEIRTVKRRKIYHNSENENDKNIIKRESDSIQIKLDEPSIPSIHSIVVRSIIPKIPSPLPIYDIHKNPIYCEQYKHLIQNSNGINSNSNQNNSNGMNLNNGLKYNQHYNLQINQYEKLKLSSKKVFKNCKLPTNVAQNNKRKIGQLLADCNQYKQFLIKKGRRNNQKQATTSHH